MILKGIAAESTESAESIKGAESGENSESIKSAESDKKVAEFYKSHIRRHSFAIILDNKICS